MEITFTRRSAMSSAIPFTGSGELAKKNYATHRFNGDGRCGDCDCRPWGVWSKYECGGGDRNEERHMEGSDGSVWVENWEIRGNEETLISRKQIA
jgi:hypothetical protein